MTPPASFDTNKQWPFYELTSRYQAPKAGPKHSTEETPFAILFLCPYSLGHYQNLMNVGWELRLTDKSPSGSALPSLQRSGLHYC